MTCPFRPPRSLLIPLSACLICGCGATTLRVSGSPTLDTSARSGFEILASLGIGMPLDYSGRSHHYVQVRPVLGGGMDTRTAEGLFVTGGEADYIYWAEPAVDVRLGFQGLFRSLPGVPTDNEGGSFGGHLGVYPIVLGDGSGWMVAQLVIGPEARIDYVAMSGPNGGRAQFSIPLVVELNMLGAGD